MDEKGFDAAAHMRKIRTRQGMQDYLDVKYRIAWLRSEFPGAQIVTELIEASATHARFKCTISLLNGEMTAIATGHGSETEQDFPDFFEKAETKAIGRACAVLGYGTDAAADFDDGTPRDGAGAAKAELRAEDRAAIEQQHERNVAPAPQTNYEQVSRATSPQPDGTRKTIIGPSPYGLKWAQLIADLKADGWNFSAWHGDTIGRELEQMYDGEEVPSTNERGGWWPSDIWAFVAKKQAAEIAESSFAVKA